METQPQCSEAVRGCQQISEGGAQPGVWPGSVANFHLSAASGLVHAMNREIGVAFVMVTHDERLAQAADRILLIEDGRIRELDAAAHRGREQGTP
jgi:hypothetical protein